MIKTNDVFHFGEQLNYVEKLIDIIKKKTKTLCKKNDWECEGSAT